MLRADPDGSIGACAGPIFSFYEFPHPMNDRLTDERWKQILDNGQAPPCPSWMQELRSE